MSKSKKANRRAAASRGTRVEKAAQNRLTSSPYPSIKRLSCEFHAGNLTLRGRVPTFYEKQVAQEAVADIGGVNRLVNGIEVVSDNPAAIVGPERGGP